MRSWSSRRQLAAARYLAVVMTLGSCDPSRPRADPPAPARTSAARAAPRVVPKVDVPRPVATEATPAAPAPTRAETERDDTGATETRFVLDGLNDVGPAAPASAYARGVVLITRGDELALAKLEQAPSRSKKPAPGAIAPVAQGAAEFWPVARGPAVSASHAYWISKGRLVRRSLDGGELEVLATDARDGTRVAVAGPNDAVAYVTRPIDKIDSRAKLRLGSGKVFDLVPDGAAASSVTLSATGDDLLVTFIDGRSGMTPVHARRYRTKAGALDADVVVWVAGATQGMTEIGSVSHAGTSWLLMPVERDASRFGLAALALAGEPRMDAPLRWRTYLNGLDRAPMASAVLCGAPTAAYVRPTSQKPGAEQELVLSELTLAETATSEAVATARGFADVSLYPIAEGAILAYVADRRSWARIVRCK